jgi:hypothetical protein
MIDLGELERRLTRPRPGRAVLFTGAGFSRGATNSRDQDVPTGREFASTLAEQIGGESDLPLTFISELYNEKRNDQSALLNLLKATFSVKAVPAAQNQIL